MVANASGLGWRRIVPAAVVAFLASVLITILIVTAYAFSLGFKARGAPDQRKISAFAYRIGPTWGPALLVLFTAAGALWVGRRVTNPVRNGAAVGLIAGAAGLLPAWPLDLRDAAIFGAVVAAGCIGAAVGRRAAAVDAPG